jgi:hypothetical protein
MALLDGGRRSDGTGRPAHTMEAPMRRFALPLILALLAVAAIAGPASAGRDFGAAYAHDAVYRVFGNRANVPDGTGTDPFAIFTNSARSDQFGVMEFAPGSPTGHHGGRWAVYRASWTALGDPNELVTSWDELTTRVAAGEITLTRDAAADFRCPVLGNPQPIG